MIAPFTICQRFAFKWDKAIPGGHCADLIAAYKYISIPNIVTDCAIVVLPFSTLWGSTNEQDAETRHFPHFHGRKPVHPLIFSHFAYLTFGYC